jgi:hypothetical protein
MPAGRVPGGGVPGGRPPGTRPPGTRPPTTVKGTGLGLSILGATLLMTAGGAVGAAADLAVFQHLGWLFGVGFVAACLVAAGRMHDHDLIAAVILPPLVYGLITITVGAVDPSDGGNGPGLKNKAIDVGTELIFRAPVLIVAMVVVVAIAGIRHRRVRAARRQRERDLAAASQQQARRRPPR